MIFEDNNILLWLYAVVPALIYSFFIYLRAPLKSLRLRSSVVYVFIGILSITFLSWIQFMLPHLQDYIETTTQTVLYDGFLISFKQPTLWAIFIFAFLQVALLEELSKWLAFRVGHFVRGPERTKKDKPFSIMFYAGMVSVAFAIVENVYYAKRAIRGDFGVIQPENVMMIRAMSSIIIHMVSGMFMGYFIALGRTFKPLKNSLYTIVGLFAAAMLHGMYDFLLMKPSDASDTLVLFENMYVHIPTTFIMILGMATAFIMSSHLFRIHYRSPTELR